MDIDVRKLRSSKPYPSGKDFFKLLKNILGTRIKDQPMLTARGMQYDPMLYVGMVAIISRALGILDTKNSTEDQRQALAQFLESDAMESLRQDTYGTYSENESRLKCYKWLKQHKNLLANNN